MISSGPFRDTASGVAINLAVTTRAGRDEIVGIIGDAVKVRLKAPPVQGQANEALLNLLAKRLDVPRSALTLTRGTTGHHKTVQVSGLRADAAQKRLLGF